MNWKELAEEEASIQGVDLDIVLATVQAETAGNNEMGDNGNAYGYGQVWYVWHKDAFEYASKRLNIQLPSSTEDVKNLVLGSNKYSMIVAVYVIKQMWIVSNKNWRSFTLSYVGPSIPESDYNRRLNIWNQYHNGSYESNMANAYTSDNKPTTSQSPLNNYTNIDIPATNYGVIPNTVTNGNVLYGRRYRVIVADANGIALDVSNLRCTFNISKTMMQEPNYSEISIYNLTSETENKIVKEGNRIILEAGYEGNQYGLIYDGDIINAMQDKEDGTTYKLTLNCLDSDRVLNSDFSALSIYRGQSSRDIINNITNRAQNPLKIGTISQDLSDSKLTRGKVIFGQTSKYLRQLSQSENAQFYMEDGKVNIVKMSDLPTGEIIQLSPSSGLLAVPAQTQYGISVKCFINPRLKPNAMFRIDNSIIRQMKATLGNYIMPLDQDGIYRIISAVYTGDTRGEEWYCTMDCVNQSGKLPTMMATPDKKVN